MGNILYDYRFSGSSEYSLLRDQTAKVFSGGMVRIEKVEFPTHKKAKANYDTKNHDISHIEDLIISFLSEEDLKGWRLTVSHSEILYNMASVGFMRSRNKMLSYPRYINVMDAPETEYLPQLRDALLLEGIKNIYDKVVKVGSGIFLDQEAHAGFYVKKLSNRVFFLRKADSRDEGRYYLSDKNNSEVVGFFGTLCHRAVTPEGLRMGSYESLTNMYPTIVARSYLCQDRTSQLVFPTISLGHNNDFTVNDITYGIYKFDGTCVYLTHNDGEEKVTLSVNRMRPISPYNHLTETQLEEAFRKNIEESRISLDIFERYFDKKATIRKIGLEFFASKAS